MTGADDAPESTPDVMTSKTIAESTVPASEIDLPAIIVRPDTVKPTGLNPAVRTILFLDHTAKMSGGEIALLNLVCALDKQQYRPVVVLASDGLLASRLREAGIETFVVPLKASVLNTRKDRIGPASLLNAGLAWACLRYTFRIAGIARQLRADIIHTNSLKADLYGGLAGRLAGIPVIWHIRDRIDRHYLPPLVAATFRHLCRVIPQAVVANSESTLKTLRLPPHKLTEVVYSGLAGTHFVLAPPPKPPADHCHATISLVGRIAAWKGQHIFLEAAAEVRKSFPHVHFQVIGTPMFGETDYEESLHQTARNLGLQDHVAFMGYRDDVPRLLAAADIIVHASTSGEPFGQVVVEAMAAGKPVVATDGGALREIVVPSETGLLVPMGDSAAMAKAIMHLLADPTLARRMGLAGRQRVQSQFMMDHTVFKMQDVYRRLLEKS